VLELDELHVGVLVARATVLDGRREPREKLTPPRRALRSLRGAAIGTIRLIRPARSMAESAEIPGASLATRRLVAAAAIAGVADRRSFTISMPEW